MAGSGSLPRLQLAIAGLATAGALASSGSLPWVVAEPPVPFEATFSGVEIISSSNRTHLWMPTPLVRTSAASDAPLSTLVDGDGSACPLPGHPPQQHQAYFEASDIYHISSAVAKGGLWTLARVGLGSLPRCMPHGRMDVGRCLMRFLECGPTSLGIRLRSPIN